MTIVERALELVTNGSRNYLLWIRSDLTKTMDGAQRRLVGGEGRWTE
jgi:hypothetical protein